MFLYITLKQNLMVPLNALSWLYIFKLQTFWVKPTDVESDQRVKHAALFLVLKKEASRFFHVTEVNLSLDGGSKIRKNMNTYCI